MKYLPEKYYIRRMLCYFKEMLPLGNSLLTSVFLYLSFNGFLGIIHGINQPDISSSAIAGIWSLFSVTVILRLMDELKDKEIDNALFPERPLPSGMVQEKDIVFTLTLAVGLYVLCNALFTDSFYFSIILLVYTFLMFRFFFMPGLLRKNLLLNLATHNPVVAVLMMYLVVLFMHHHNITTDDIHWSKVILLILMFWSILFSWEISRKIRSEVEENEYVTYSQIFGRAGATGILSAAQTFALGCGIYFYYSFQLSPLFMIIVCLGYAMAMYANIRFILNPNSITSHLKPFTEKYMLSILVAMTVQQIFSSSGVMK
jgi:4-hydroxybenzoate polyprenyltransferase